MQDGNASASQSSPFGGRFRELRGRLALTQEQIARRLGVTTATYNRYEKGHREPAAGLLHRMSALAPGINAEWLLTGRGVAFGTDPTNGTAALLRVPILKTEAPGAGGAPGGQMEPNTMLAFSREWVRNELKCDPDRLFLLEMAGDSMTPTILPGELMLVHQWQGSPIHDGIYVLRVGGAVQVRRLQWLSAEELEFVPDNPLYKSRVVTPAEASEGNLVIGRVVWSGKRY